MQRAQLATEAKALLAEAKSGLSLVDAEQIRPRALLTPTPRASLDRDEYLALMGALGVFVGLALATINESGS
jgi:hypothetical protein